MLDNNFIRRFIKLSLINVTYLLSYYIKNVSTTFFLDKHGTHNFQWSLLQQIVFGLTERQILVRITFGKVWVTTKCHCNYVPWLSLFFYKEYRISHMKRCPSVWLVEAHDNSRKESPTSNYRCVNICFSHCLKSKD